MIVFKETLIVFLVLCYGDNNVLVSSEKSQDAIENRNSNETEDSSWYRLPEYVLPENYELWILQQLAVNNFTYDGRVEIDLRIILETNLLTVHAVGLKIDRERTKVFAIVNETRIDVSILKQQLDVERQMYVVSLVENLSPGRYVLSMVFSGEVLDDVFGFYRSSYQTAEKKRWLGVTQFSTIFARRAFPCLDEPYLKATFRLHIGHYGNETVTGNTAAENVREIKPGYFLTSLARSPRMSTYLVGWAIHDFTYTEAPNSTTFGLWTRERMRNSSSRFLNECIEIYDVLAQLFSVENPIKKMEQVAVPDFYFSAMENWGMVTFRESVILWEENGTPATKIYNGLGTIAHEYAHTWFGNLVTPKFWNVAWLKEGFATFLGNYALGIVHDDWRMMDLFAVDVLQPALLEDSFRHDRTMNGKGVGSPKSIPPVMDFVTYKKASSIIRMVYHIIGDLAFRRGLRSYIETLAYKYAVPSDLYEHLQRFANEDTLEKSIWLSDVIESWANQPGYPIVSVTRNYSTNVTEISQDKYHLNRSQENGESDDSRWWIPINFATVESGTRDVAKAPSAWIIPQNRSISITTISPIDTVLCNIHQAYYYRVNYDLTNWRRLTSHLRSTKFRTIGAANRASLIDDSFNLAKAGYIHYSVPLELSRYLIQETDYEPWLAATNSIDFLNLMLNGSPDVKRAFQMHVNRLIEPIFKNLTFYRNSSDQMRTRLMRRLIMSTACSINNIHCLNTANSLFKEWLNDPDKKIDPDSKSPIYCAGIRSSNFKDWRRLLRIFLETELHTEQESLIAGLGCTNNFTLVNEFLNYSLYDGPEVRKQYRLTIFDSVLSGNPENVDHTLTFVDKNLERITSTRDSAFLNKIFELIKKRIVLEGQLEKLRILVESNVELLGSSIENARGAIKFAEDNISWIRKYTPEIRKWLN